MAKARPDDSADGKGVARMNITMPHELRRRMDAVAEPVNWSAVAAEAFRVKLLKLQAQRKVTTMSDTVKRLKALQELEGDELYQAGREAGGRWAKEAARPVQLRRLSRTADRDYHGSAGEMVAVYANGLNAGPMIGVAQTINGEPDGGRAEAAREAEAFWVSEVGVPAGDIDDVDNESFATGFVEAALEVWGAVEGEL